METILVTGGAGFTGSHPCRCLLRDGYHVISVGNFDSFCDLKHKNGECGGNGE